MTKDQIKPKQRSADRALVLSDTFLKKEIKAKSVKAMARSITKIFELLSNKEGKANVINKMGSKVKNKVELAKFEKLAAMPLIGEW